MRRSSIAALLLIIEILSLPSAALATSEGSISTSSSADAVWTWMVQALEKQWNEVKVLFRQAGRDAVVEGQSDMEVIRRRELGLIPVE